MAFAILITFPLDTLAAAGEDFYRNLLRRGISQFENGDHSSAVKALRVAAFGLVDSVDEFETAHIYLAIANDVLKREPDARHSAQRVIAAERVSRRYASLRLPQPIRTRFETVAGKVLTSDQVAMLHGAPPPQPTQPTTMVVQRQTPPTTLPSATGTNHRSVPAPQPVTPAPQPQPKTPQPQTPVPQPKTPQPQPPTPTPVPQPENPQPQPSTPAPAPQPKTPQPQPFTPTPIPVPVQAPVTKAPPPPPKPAINIDAELAKGERALDADDIVTAKTIFNALIALPSASHAQRIRIAEGLTRARDFEGAARAFNFLGVLRKGEEHYHFYYAIALYETGNYRAAKREMDAALPFIENTLAVAAYRTKIERALR